MTNKEIYTLNTFNLSNKERLEFDKLYEEYQFDKANVLPTKPYVGNCSKEFTEKIVQKYWKREFDKIQTVEFPPVSFYVYDKTKCGKELQKLISTDYSSKLYNNNPSACINYFHKSLYKANTQGNLSPYDGWQLIKSDEEVFKDFYRNRLRCSDWFKTDGRLPYLLTGQVMMETYGIGLSTSRKYQHVTYFKPITAKNIIQKYLNNYDTIFDPFSGYSGRMLGAIALGKNYIGQDLCQDSVNESNEMWTFIKHSSILDNYFDKEIHCEILHKDTLKSFGKHDCLFTCPPYDNIENWPGVKSLNYNCDKWVDVCLSHFDCEKYVFVVDDKIDKYKPFIVDKITNTSHFKSNVEYILLITKDDLKNIHFDINGDSIEYNGEEQNFLGQYSELGTDLLNVFNQKLFNYYVDCPIEFKDWLELIYKKFNRELKGVRPYRFELNHIELKNKDNRVLLACSGGLDSTYQIFQLRRMGYEPILYHMRNVNYYENGQSYKSVLSISEKTNTKLACVNFKKHLDVNYQKCWPENPIKNQFILFTMIDYCYKNDINKICMDGSWEFPIDEVTAGIDVADAPENYELWLKSISNYVDNLEFIKTSHSISKFDKIKDLDKEGLMDDVYSCLNVGRLNEYNHNHAEQKFGVQLFKHNCGCSCRKCSHHNLLMYYKGYRSYPKTFIDKCWKTMANNGFNSRDMLFNENIPIEQRIENLFVE